MFTGLIETIGVLKSIKPAGDGNILFISIPNYSEISFDISKGDSVATNGICLTAVSWSTGQMEAFASGETISKTTLKEWKPGQKLNLERALTLNSRLGGHIVAGHVDGVGKLADRKKAGQSELFTFEAPGNLMLQIVEKGSVAINGVSLTCFNVTKNTFSTAIIPETVSATTLKDLGKGDIVNLETDIIGKYLLKYFEQYLGSNKIEMKSAGNITLDILRNSGFTK